LLTVFSFLSLLIDTIESPAYFLHCQRFHVSFSLLIRHAVFANSHASAGFEDFLLSFHYGFRR